MRPLSGLRVFLTTDFIGGIWSYSADLAEGLCGRGATVVLAGIGPPSTPSQRDRAATIRGLTLIDTGLPLDWTATDSRQVRATASAIARKATGDIIHLHTPALAAFDDFAAPVIVGCHSCLATWWAAVEGTALPPSMAWRRDIAAAGYAAASALIAPSRAFATATTSAYGPSVQPTVVYNGRQRIAGRPATAEQDVVFTSGRLWDRGKNLAVLDRAASSLRWPILAAGPCDGPNADHIALNHIRSLGRLDQDAIANHLAARPVFATAARYEPFGLSVLEAAQAACALVLSDIPTFRELWDEAAIFVHPDDAAGYVAAITSLLGNPAKRAAQGAAAAAHAARYTSEANVAATLAIYQAHLARAAA